jgi:CRISPR/Cas system-associated exonuclease Cas4 (RecB family)
MSRSDVAVVAATEAVRIPAASLGILLRCPRCWFLQQRAGGEGGTGLAARIGTVMHQLFELDTVSGPLSPDVATEFLREQWAALPYRAAALREAGFGLALAAFARYAVWRAGRAYRSVVASERAFQIQLALPSGPVLLTGKVDRIESDAAGRAVVVDYKTGKNAKVDKHLEQLACYELAVATGALGPDVPLAVANAELVWPYLAPRSRSAGDVGCQVTSDPGVLFELAGVELALPERAESLLALIDQGAATVRAERFDAIPGKQCVGCAFRRGCPALGGLGVEGGDDE